MLDQADQLRQLVRETVQTNTELRPGLPLIAVSGGKGGVGTSTIAVELAQQLVRLGKKVVLVDANPRQPDLANLLNITCRESLADVLAGARSAREVLTNLSDSLAVLPGRWAAVAPDMSPSAVNRLLSELRGLENDADLVLVDCGSGMNPWAQQFWLAADQVLLLTTPEPTAVMDSYAAVKLSPWQKLADRLHLVVNQAESPEQAAQIMSRVADTCHRFLNMPWQQSIATAVLGKPKSAKFSKSIRALAADLLSERILLIPSSARARQLASPKQPQTELQEISFYLSK